jgi:hypothetical protein
MTEVDGPIFIFMDFYVPAPVPRLNWIETSLQLSENTILFAMRGMHASVIDKEDQINTWCLGAGVSFIWKLENVGNMTIHWGTPALFFYAWTFRLRQKLYFRSDRKELLSLIKFVKNCNLCNSYNRPVCHVVTEAFSIFKNTAAVDMLLLKFKVEP